VPVQTILHIVNESSIYGGEIGLDVMSIRTHAVISTRFHPNQLVTCEEIKSLIAPATS